MDQYLYVSSGDSQLVDAIYHILSKCGWNMARNFLFHWIPPYSRRAIRKDCSNKIVVLVKSEKGCFTSTFQMYVTPESNLYVRKIATLPSCEGQGIGKRNMQYMEAFAREKGCSKVCLDVYSKSIRAVKFYQKCGYEIVGEKRSVRFKEYLMEKEVK